MNVIVLLVMLIGFPNPLHWRHKHSTVSVAPLGVYVVEQPPYSDSRCFGDDTGVFIIEPDDSIGYGYTCDEAMEKGRELDPAIRWNNERHSFPYHKI